MDTGEDQMGSLLRYYLSCKLAATDKSNESNQDLLLIIVS